MKVTSQRFEGARKRWEDVHERDANQTLRAFIEYELGYGGQITGVDSDKDDSHHSVEVTTFVLGMRDVTVYEGSFDEMRPFYEVAYLAEAHHDTLLKKNFEPIIDEIMDVTSGNPLLIKMSEGIIRGSHIARAAMAYICSFQDLEFMKTLLGSKLPLKDLSAAHELIVSGATQEDIKDLLGLL